MELCRIGEVDVGKQSLDRLLDYLDLMAISVRDFEG